MLKKYRCLCLLAYKSFLPKAQNSIFPLESKALAQEDWLPSILENSLSAVLKQNKNNYQTNYRKSTRRRRRKENKQKKKIRKSIPPPKSFTFNQHVIRIAKATECKNWKVELRPILYTLKSYIHINSGA